ncbi:hypothetical protein [Streptomyces sp. MS2.AVA.5]|uniref:Uncharacterized protein n=1 Tax=Streptomyces achmelvichensis TaxID=3134111 RepID=A0ACC6Q638_9ACTN
MRVRVATTALGITAALLSVPACSTNAAGTRPDTAPSARTGKPADAAQQAAPLTSAMLETRLLDQSDLGSGYLRKPERPTQNDDVTVIGCPTYQVVAGGTPIDMASQRLPAPRGLGDEQWSQLLTFSTGGRSTVVKQTAIRDDSLLLIVSGSPALVDRHLDKALAKATATS